jgi:hypothetical protein
VPRRVPLIARTRAESNVAPFDWWTLVHIGWGAGAGALRANPWAFLGATAVYEVLEFCHEHPRGSPLFGSKRPESAANMLADVGVATLAYAIARHVRDR